MSNDIMSEDLKTHLSYMEHDRRIEKHYAHAREKHPYFCDRLLYDGWKREDLVSKLDADRIRLKYAIEDNMVSMPHVLSCEMSEAVVEIYDGDTAAAVEELYDAIAVLLRTIDVLEGRQRLGQEGASA